MTSRERPSRLLGEFGFREGPLVIAIGGLHGNEPSGVRAIQRMLATLHSEKPDLRGHVVGLRGNIAALLAGKRFLDRDLNRSWIADAADPAKLAELPDGEASDGLDTERREQLELLEAIDSAVVEHQSRPGPTNEIVLLDLHSTSTGDAPFIVLSDTLKNRRIALRLEIPVVLGLEERVPGTLLEFMTGRGATALCIEGGQHGQEASADNHEAALWLALVAIGVVSESEVPRLRDYRARLRTACRNCPRITEVTYRYGIEPDERFRMQPGFRNFDHVDDEVILATSGPSEVHPPHRGRLLMPLYQAQGTDGFFLVRRVGYGWLVLSAMLRRLGLDRFLTLLPAVKRAEYDKIVVDLRVARFFVPQVFHLFGFRLVERTEARAVFRRRRDNG